MTISRRRAALAVAALVIAGVLLAVLDPFHGTSGASGSSDNGSATALATVQRRSLSSQDEVSGTLGYAGSYDVTVPVGTPGATLAQDQAAVHQAQARVSADQQALATAQAQAGSQSSAQIAAAQAQLASATAALNEAKRQLEADSRLGCPPASPATVTTPTPTATPHTDAAAVSSTGRPAVTTGTATQTSTTSATLSGVVNPHGLATTYYFRYGTTARLGQRTAATTAGAGSEPVEVSAHVAKLTADTTYDVQLVATNSAGTTTGEVQTFRTAQSSCAAQQQVVAADSAAVTAARDSLAAAQSGGGEAVAQAEQQLAADQAIAAADEQALAQAQQHTSTGSASASQAQTVTALPDSGATLRAGQRVYSLDGAPVPLFFGTTIPWRALSAGVSDGPDVAQLERNLVSLGFADALHPDDHFDGATTAAVKRWQDSIGQPQTGVVDLGAIAVEPGPIRIVTVTAKLGQAVQPGTAILSASSTARQVVVEVDATQQSEVKAGDLVTITLPDNSTTPGVVSSVGAVATASASSTSSGGGSSSGAGSSQTPTISVDVTPTRPQDTGHVDQAPVTVAITTAIVPDALVVPVTALLALAGGGYALEVVPTSGPHQLVAVRLGLFDDADGLVQVSGSGVRAGQRVVVPARA